MTTTDWIATGSILTGVSALATALMAFFTRKAAEDTSAMAKATVEEAKAIEQQLGHSAAQVRVAEQSLRASAQPWLAWEATYEVQAGTRPHVYAHGSLRLPGTHSGAEVREGTGRLVGFILVRNVGNGLAIVDLSESWILPCTPRVPGKRQRCGHPATDTPVIPAGGCATIDFTVDLGEEAGGGPTFKELVGRPSTSGQFALEVCYSDAIQGSSTRATFSLESPQGGDQWVVSRIEYETADNAQAAVTATYREQRTD